MSTDEIPPRDDAAPQTGDSVANDLQARLDAALVRIAELERAQAAQRSNSRSGMAIRRGTRAVRTFRRWLALTVVGLAIAWGGIALGAAFAAAQRPPETAQPAPTATRPQPTPRPTLPPVFPAPNDASTQVSSPGQGRLHTPTPYTCWAAEIDIEWRERRIGHARGAPPNIWNINGDLDIDWVRLKALADFWSQYCASQPRLPPYSDVIEPPYPPTPRPIGTRTPAGR